MARKSWVDLCGPWQFAYDDGDVGLREEWHERAERFERTIVAPYPPESRLSGIGETAPHPVVWYRRTFRASTEGDGRVLLHFGAVDYLAHVWVNGRLVARHEGGHTPFSADVTAALSDEKEQVLVVRAEDRPEDLTQPRGKQDWHDEPHRIWYDRTTGIWQPVWLERTGHSFIEDVRWTPELDRGCLGVTVRLNPPPTAPFRLRLRLSLHGAALADETWTLDRMETSRTVDFPDNLLTMDTDRLIWSPRNPNLIDAELTLLDRERELDRVQSYAGMRSAGGAGGRLMLNGRPDYLRLVLAQNFWPESHLAAPSAEALRREVELAKELGFNGVRIHQKVEDPRFLYWCDRLGVLVWGEMANAYAFSPVAVERLTREWLEVVRRDVSHPSIVAWVPFNESWGAPNLEGDPQQRDFVRALYYLTKALDPTRPVIGNEGWEHVESDVWGIHDYAFFGTALSERYGSPEVLDRTLRTGRPAGRIIARPDDRAHTPVMLTEFGGITDAPEPGQPWWGYGTAGDADALLAKYEELVGAVLDSPVVAGFCYTQLTDTQQERNGLLTAEREPKVDLAAIRAINTRPSRALMNEAVHQIQAAAMSGSLGDADSAATETE
ncbi:MAG: glycoside hydrolase family 2 protein [Thermomicrobiales bacterium]